MVAQQESVPCLLRYSKAYLFVTCKAAAHHGAALKACLIVTAGCLHHLDFYFCRGNTVHRTFLPIVKNSADFYCRLLAGLVKASPPKAEQKKLISTQLPPSRLRQSPPDWSTPPPRLQRPNNLPGKLSPLALNRETSDKPGSSSEGFFLVHPFHFTANLARRLVRF